MQSPMQPADKDYISWERVGRAANACAERLAELTYHALYDQSLNRWNPDLWVYLHRGGAIPAALVWRAYKLHWRPKTYNLIPVSVQSYTGENVQNGIVADYFHLEREKLIGKDVLIIDDLIDTGESMKEVARKVDKMGAKSIRTMALFSKRFEGANIIGEMVNPDQWLDFPWEREASNFV